MQPPYTFKNLELITRGDPALDVELLEIFLTTSREYIAGMQAAHRENNDDVWQRQAHELKGGCFSIGADCLGEICENAQSEAEIPATLRAQALQKIENEFARLEQAILELIKEKSAKITLPRMI